MSFIKPAFRHPDLPTNKLGYTKKDYEGAISTLCAGCGHDSISAAIVQSCLKCPCRRIKLQSFRVLVVHQNPDLLFSQLTRL